MFNDLPEAHFSSIQNRLYLRHGPIDLHASIELVDRDKNLQAYRLLADAFKEVLPTLCGELGCLRAAVSSSSQVPAGPVARRMHAAACAFSGEHFVTPMIAVAGSVADHLADIVAGRFAAKRIFINNGGDIALRLFDDRLFTVGICGDTASYEIASQASISAADGIGGIATSGWQGRSHSLGIADAVTVFAQSAAVADAAATLIANAVDLPDSNKISREEASTLAPDSDLGSRLVTTAVAPLSNSEKRNALARGLACAQVLMQSGFLHSTYLSLQGREEVVHAGPVIDHIIASSASTQPLQPAGLIHA